MRILLVGLHKDKIHDTDERQAEARSLHSLTEKRFPFIVIPFNIAVRDMTDKHNDYKNNKHCHSSFHFFSPFFLLMILLYQMGIVLSIPIFNFFNLGTFRKKRLKIRLRNTPWHNNNIFIHFLMLCHALSKN